MKVRAMILGGILAMGLAAPALAAGSDLLDGSNVDEILKLAKGYGDASLETQSNGDPKIKGVMDDVSYSIYFMNCIDNEDCEDLNFYAGFLDLKPKQEDINSWNRDKRFGKAYIDTDGDAVVEMDLNLEHGVSSDNLKADIDVWKLVLGEYTDYIGFKK